MQWRSTAPHAARPPTVWGWRPLPEPLACRLPLSSIPAPARAAAGAWRLQQGCHWTPANRRGLAPAVWRIPPLHLARPFFHPESTTPRRRCRRRPRRFIVFECRQRFPACVRSRKTRINSLRAHNSFESGRKHVRSRLVDAVTLDGSFSRVMPLLDRENGS